LEHSGHRTEKKIYKFEKKTEKKNNNEKERKLKWIRLG
jgi:hypothetical protein